jgi:hypothetical protein
MISYVTLVLGDWRWVNRGKNGKFEVLSKRGDKYVSDLQFAYDYRALVGHHDVGFDPGRRARIGGIDCLNCVIRQTDKVGPQAYGTNGVSVRARQ